MPEVMRAQCHGAPIRRREHQAMQQEPQASGDRGVLESPALVLKEVWRESSEPMRPSIALREPHEGQPLVPQPTIMLSAEEPDHAGNHFTGLLIDVVVPRSAGTLPFGNDPEKPFASRALVGRFGWRGNVQLDVA